MIPFEHALQIILEAANPIAPPCEFVSLEKANGRILQQTVSADRDMPPFDKSAVDGYACTFTDLEQRLPMRLLEVIAAGSVPKHVVAPGFCSKVMTGAPVPDGTECVLMFEDAYEEHGFVYTTGNPGRKTNICLQGEDLTAGAPVLSPGRFIQPQHIGILAALGCTTIRVSKKIKVGLISTGDELTEPWESPRTTQIRNSNSRQLMAQAKRVGVLTAYYGIARDHADSFAPLLSAALEDNDVVIVSGGVSMGDFDIVPEVAQNLGIKILFDRVAVQPGKPTTFGVGKSSFFFGLPGNPVSSFIQFELMVKPFLMRLMGASFTPISLRLPITLPYQRKQAERLAHLPATLDPTGACCLIDYHGSGHITALDRMSCIARIPIGITSVAAGAFVEVILL